MKRTLILLGTIVGQNDIINNKNWYEGIKNVYSNEPLQDCSWQGKGF